MNFRPTVGLLACALSAPGYAEQISAVAKKESTSVVEIMTADQTGKPLGNGSGFIVRADGILLTNHHVIDGASTASVTLANGDIYDDITVLDSDKRRDLALIKIKALNLPVSQIGDSDALEIGQHVIAIGNPEGLARSVSDGIISAFRQGDGFRVIQTTAPISHGSSGGPLMNDSGQVIGITYAALMEGQNLNLAVPINYVKAMLQEVDRHAAQTLLAYNSGRLKSAPVADDASKSEARTGTPAKKADAPNSVPAEMKDGIGQYLDKRLGQWTVDDAHSLLGDSTAHRFAYDLHQTVDGDVYSFADPTRYARLLELNFDLKTQKLRAVYIYPYNLTWDDCKRLWGENVQRVRNPDGTKFFAYKDRRLTVLLDKKDNVISIGLSTAILGR
jgi:S1-C subfamily serine protease